MLNCYYVLNFVSKFLQKFAFSLKFSLCNSLSFASWPANLKICQICPFTEKVCQPLLYTKHIFLLLLPTASLHSLPPGSWDAASERCCERTSVRPEMIIPWGNQAIPSLLEDKKLSLTRGPKLSFPWPSTELCSYRSSPSTGLCASGVQESHRIQLCPQPLTRKCAWNVCKMDRT